MSEKSNHALKLLQKTVKDLELNFTIKKKEYLEFNTKADQARDAMLRIEGAIQQIKLSIKQLNGEEIKS
jgi:hypothetical protein